MEEVEVVEPVGMDVEKDQDLNEEVVESLPWYRRVLWEFTDHPFVNALVMTSVFDKDVFGPLITAVALAGGEWAPFYRDSYYGLERNPVVNGIRKMEAGVGILILNEKIRDGIIDSLVWPAANIVHQGLKEVVEEIEQVEILGELIDGFEQQPEALIPIAATLVALLLSRKINQIEGVQNWKARRRTERESAIDEGRDELGSSEGSLRGLFRRRLEDADEEREARPEERVSLMRRIWGTFGSFLLEQFLTSSDDQKVVTENVGEVVVGGNVDGSSGYLHPRTAQRPRGTPEYDTRTREIDNNKRRPTVTSSIETSWVDGEQEVTPQIEQTKLRVEDETLPIETVENLEDTQPVSVPEEIEVESRVTKWLRNNFFTEILLRLYKGSPEKRNRLNMNSSV